MKIFGKSHLQARN